MKFKASFSNAVYAISAGCVVLFGVITYATLNNPDLLLPYQLLIIGFLWVTFVVCWFLHSTGYTVTADAVIIHRPLSKVTILKSQITEVSQPTEGDMKWTIRTFGVGGLFGYFGKFTNTAIGGMTWYATRRENYVLLRLANKRIILTPDEPKQFIAATGI
ncbi:MAG TPA: PH domain-containing protein [Chitinophagales bacterium]|nr:PH domain-containing protein [Chitinophagales bacterium]